MLEENLAKTCPACGHHNAWFESVCQGDGCSESLQGVESTALDQQTQFTPDTTQKKEQEDAAPQQQPGAGAERRTVKMSRSIAIIQCQDQPDFTFEISDGSILGCDSDKATVDLTHLARSRHISGKHASIRFLNGEWYIQDEDSTNGTLVNGQKIPKLKPFPIQDGDTLTLANTTFIFQDR